MTPRAAAVMIAVALALAGLAWLSGEAAVQRKHDLVRRGWNLQPVLAAARDLSPGVPLSREDLVPRAIPEQFVTASLFTDARLLEGQVLAVPLSKGTPLHAATLVERRHCPP